MYVIAHQKSKNTTKHGGVGSLIPNILYSEYLE